jgi:hypothetical protein
MSRTVTFRSSRRWLVSLAIGLVGLGGGAATARADDAPATTAETPVTTIDTYGKGVSTDTYGNESTADTYGKG